MVIDLLLGAYVGIVAAILIGRVRARMRPRGNGRNHAALAHPDADGGELDGEQDRYTTWDEAES